MKSEDLGKGKGKADGVDGKEGDGETEQRSEWNLVEDVEIKASRLLVGTVKGKCEENWRGIHGRFVGHLKEGEAKA